VLFAAPGSESSTRVGISVSKRVGGAVVRNRVKRRVREIMREQLSSLKPGFDLMIVARQESATASYTDLAEALTRLLVRAALVETSSCSASSK
jgi:ribonuclease P protein component